LILFTGVAHSAASQPRRLATFANPIDLPYRYQPRTRGPSYREAADPTIVRFKGRYWLFASHSKGYWWSTDLRNWTFVEGRGYSVNRFAPTVIVSDGKLYLTASERTKKIWVTDDPMNGEWSEAADISPGY
jgi:beta-xylosidase